jgi:hypothetical protein
MLLDGRNGGDSGNGNDKPEMPSEVEPDPDLEEEIVKEENGDRG